jgi:hypothetical protein
MDDTRQKPKGLIRYVLLVVSHPVQPNPQQTFEFLNKILPELRTQHDDSPKIGTLWETTPIAGIDMTAKAAEAFGASIVNNDLYIYRTLHLGLGGGDAECLVVYDKPGSSRSSKKWWRFWK